MADGGLSKQKGDKTVAVNVCLKTVGQADQPLLNAEPPAEKRHRIDHDKMRARPCTSISPHPYVQWSCALIEERVDIRLLPEKRNIC